MTTTRTLSGQTRQTHIMLLLKFVRKVFNATNMPQYRPIEDHFGRVTKLFCKNGCSAAKTDKLISRIKYSLRKNYMQFVQRKFQDIRKKPSLCYKNKCISCLH